jgi:hypothetical protein
MSLVRLAIPLLCSLLFAAPGHALTIDAFKDDGFVSSTSTIGTTKTTLIPSTQAAGGGRSLSATKSGSGTGVSRLEIVDSSLGYTQGAHSGFASITWDGDTDPSSIKPNGLGSLDFTQDEGTAFKIGLVFFDYPSNQPVQLKLRIYDSSTPDGSKFSEVTITLDQFYGGPDIFYISVPFTMFSTAGTSAVPAPGGLTFSTTTTLGAGGAARVTHVGAISLAFRGDLNSRAPDIILAPFITNGKCSAVPDSTGRAIDECSVCHEDANAKQGTDRCGVCYAGPSGYSYETNKSFDSCGLCPSEPLYQFPSGSVDKCGTCLGGPPLYTYVDKRDACGVCGGKATQKKNCTIGPNGCPLVKPTAKILGFEKSLIEKASLLRGRYQSDLRRSKAKKCSISFAESNKRVAAAFNAIKSSSQSIFGAGIEVCQGSCVTVSYASEVKALTPYFKTLENEASTAAKLVQQCYKKLGINKETQGASPGETDRTVAAVRAGLGNLIRECRKTNVCKKP